MSISRDNTPELNRDEYTEYIYDVTCFGDPINPENAEDVASGISRAMELETRPVFLEGVSARLSQLGIACIADDVELMSDMSGIGILLEFDSKDYPITLSTNEGHFTTWDKETGVGVVSNVGKTYDIGNKGYVFWTPDSLNFDEDFESEIIMVGDNNGKNIELGKLVVNMNDKHSLTAVLK